MSGKRRLEHGERQREPARTYLTQSELECVETLAATYGSTANVLRQGVGTLVRLKHPELIKLLREDLRGLFIPSSIDKG